MRNKVMNSLLETLKKLSKSQSVGKGDKKIYVFSFIFFFFTEVNTIKENLL